MCGMPLPLSVAASIPSPEHQPPRETSWHDQDSSRETRSVSSQTNFYEEPQSRHEQRTNELASLYPSRDDDSEAPDPAEGLFHYQSEPRRNYRLYIGIALVAVIALLAYRAWRGNITSLSSGSAPSALPQAVPALQEPEAATPTERAPTASAQPPAQQSSQNHEANAAPENPAQPIPKPRADHPLNARRATAPSANQLTTASEQTSMNSQYGAEELATAEKYLNGETQDPQQAASWLWKSVAKQNLTAALLLSDLYVHGEGVAKNCDQARLLLDAAARKGSAAAAVRLRNLPAFGCQ
jgi:TPR repeat protein